MRSTRYDHFDQDRAAALAAAPVPVSRANEFDSFAAPATSHRIGDAPSRSRVTVRGEVLDVQETRWVEGPVLEVTLSDGTGKLHLEFLGRRHVNGIETGCELVVAGTIGKRQCRAVVLNPCYWLIAAPCQEVTDA